MHWLTLNQHNWQGTSYSTAYSSSIVSFPTDYLVTATMYIPMDQVTSGFIVGYPAYGSSSASPSLICGIHGRALQFNGIDQYVDLGTHDDECMGNPDLCPNGFTWAMWLKIEPNNGVDTNFILSSPIR